MAALIPAIPAWLSTTLTVASTLMSVAGGISQAKSMQGAAEANARNAAAAADANRKQLDQQAGQEDAAGQHAALAKLREWRIRESRARALASASGATVDESFFSGFTEEGMKEAGYLTYQAGERATGLRYQGDVGVANTQNQNRENLLFARSQSRATLLGAAAKAGMSLASLAPGAAPTDSMAGYKGEYSNLAYDVGNYS